MRERRGYVLLVLMSIFLSLGVLLFGTYQQKANNHKFCDVTNSLITKPVPKPANPKADPSRERSWELYEKFVLLDQSLGC